MKRDNTYPEWEDEEFGCDFWCDDLEDDEEWLLSVISKTWRLWKFMDFGRSEKIQNYSTMCTLFPYGLMKHLVLYISLIFKTTITFHHLNLPQLNILTIYKLFTDFVP